MTDPMAFFLLTLALVAMLALCVGGMAFMDHLTSYGETWQVRVAFVLFLLVVMSAIVLAVMWMHAMSVLITGWM